MDLKDALTKGVFVSGPPIKKEIPWVHYLENGELAEDSVTIYIKRLSWGRVQEIIKSRDEKNADAEMIAQCIVDAEGNPAFTYQQVVDEIDLSFRILLAAEIDEVIKPKKSLPSMNSGTS